MSSKKKISDIEADAIIITNMRGIRASATRSKIAFMALVNVCKIDSEHMKVPVVLSCLTRLINQGLVLEIKIQSDNKKYFCLAEKN